MGLQRKRDQRPKPQFVRGKWVIRYTEYHADGTEKRPLKTLGTKEEYPNLDDAKRARDKFMRGINESAAVTRFEDLCDDYRTDPESDYQYLRQKTKKTRNSTINKLCAAFGPKRLDELAAAQGRHQMQHWLNRQVTTMTTRTLLKNSLSQIFSHAVNNDILIGDNPVTKIRLHHMPQFTKPPRKRTVLTPAQFMALMNHPALPEHAKVLVAIMEMCGLRSCEALGLSWEYGSGADYREADIDLFSTPPQIHVRRSVSWSKNPNLEGVNAYIDPPKSFDSRRTVPIPPVLTRMLLRFRSKYPIMNGWVFGSTDAKALGRWWSQSAIHKLVKDAARDLGFDYYGFGLHNHRHTARRNLKLTGAGTEDQARLLGHSPKNLQQTMAYGNDGVDFAEELAPLIDRLAGVLDKDGQLDSICGPGTVQQKCLTANLSANSTCQIIDFNGVPRHDQILPQSQDVENKATSIELEKTKTA